MHVSSAVVSMTARYPLDKLGGDLMALMTTTVALSEFQDIRDGNKYYVDKSLLIKDLLSKDDRGAYLFIRPRRFGKSMNLSMLDAFFNVKYKGNHWFDGLKISEYHEYDDYKNRFPVIRLDLKELNVTSWEDFLESLEGRIIDIYSSYDDLLDGNLSSYHRDYYQMILKRGNGSGVLEYSLSTLATMLRRRYDSKVIVLIDEYDNPLTSTLGFEINGKIAGFLKSIYSRLLKGNTDIQMSYVTGTSRAIHQGFFSGLNNMRVDDVFSTMSDERFGFTESETKALLDYYGVPEKIDEVREWYDGYRFGDVDVYNPFSLMSYIGEDFKPSPYWKRTSSNSILKWILERIDARRALEMSRVLIGESVDFTLPAYAALSDMDLPEDWHLFYVLVEMGYLKIVPDGGDRFLISIPNKEVSFGIEFELTHAIGLNHEVIDKLVNSLTSMDDRTTMDCLGILLNDQSFFNLTDERHYAAVLTIAIRSLNRGYRIILEPDRIGHTVDVFLLPRTEGKESIIIGIRRVDEADQMESAMEHVFDRIQRSKSYQGICGDVVMTGMVFCGNNSLVRSNRVHIDGRFLTKYVEYG